MEIRLLCTKTRYYDRLGSLALYTQPEVGNLGVIFASELGFIPLIDTVIKKDFI